MPQKEKDMNRSCSTGSAQIGVDVELLRATYDAKYSNEPALGWGPSTRRKFGHYSPDEHYETVVAELITRNCDWLDVGCGREIFPSNRKLAAVLSSRARMVVGVDPDRNIYENPCLTEAHQGPIESYNGSTKFDVVTFRMVAEHVEHPKAVIAKLEELVKPTGRVVIFTPNKWSPMSIMARFTSLETHHFFKRLLWQTDERDTFPVQFKMNTKRDLHRLFCESGFELEYFQYLDDCRTFNRFRVLNYIELCVWKALNSVRIHYPETCLLAVFRKNRETE